MIRHSIAGAMVLVAWSGAAIAAPATPEEAQRLTALFGHYLGKPGAGPSPVTVVPHGEAYTATLDLGRLFGFMTAFGVDVTAGDLVAELAPQPDGQWHVTVAGLPPVGFGKDTSAVSVALAGYSFDGLFDPAMEAFSTSTARSTGSTIHVRDKGTPLDIAVTSTSVGTSKAVGAGPGLVDVGSTSSNTDIEYRISETPATSDAHDPAKEVGRVTIGSTASELSLRHQPIVALNELWQFLVAHPSRAELAAAQPELKSRLKAVVPLAEGASGSLAATKIAVSTPLGAFALGRLEEKYGSNADGRANNSITLRFAGLDLPSGLLPAWATPLLPTSLDYTQTYGPIQASDALRLAIDDLDLAAAKPLTDAQQQDILRAAGTDHMTVTIAPSTIVTPRMTVTFNGQVVIDKPRATGTGTFAAKGLDATIEAVRAAAPNDPSSLQAITLLMAAKGLGKAEGPDSYSWVVAEDATGAVTVNGAPLAAMNKALQAKPRKTSVQP